MLISVDTDYLVLLGDTRTCQVALGVAWCCNVSIGAIRILLRVARVTNTM